MRLCCKRCEVDEFYFPRSDAQIESRNRDGQAEPARAGTAGIQIQNAITLRARGLMRMAADDNLKTRGDGIEIQLLKIVQDVYSGGTSLHDVRTKEGGRSRAPCRHSP